MDEAELSKCPLVSALCEHHFFFTINPDTFSIIIHVCHLYMNHVEDYCFEQVVKFI